MTAAINAHPLLPTGAVSDPGTVVPNNSTQLTDDQTAIYDQRAERAAEARRHREAARRSTALAIGSGDIGTYRILMAFAHEHELRAAELDGGPQRR